MLDGKQRSPGAGDAGANAAYSGWEAIELPRYTYSASRIGASIATVEVAFLAARQIGGAA